MDDTCVVCAETLDWVAYGPCGHREVCSTCIARLRFICADRRCCLCKSESKVVFMTKALGDYTRMINEFSIFPDDTTEGKVGPYWCHESTQAYFDDQDHYKMIKAMCRLSCSVCVKMDGQVNQRSKGQIEFKNIEQLKSHLFHKHKLFMCILCLEGRKVFMCEQKLYTREQLNQHINTGDTEVDGTESDRGGFTGHPTCEFCRNPFYGDNELYLHMSTEHYTCHICQRQHPGKYEYYRNYDHLETHFRGEHYLCEDEGCLAKKFIVFAAESQIKRHNAMEHGGNMSRSKRNASLQLPTNFRYQQSHEEDHHGRRRGHRSDSFNNQLSMAIQASLGTSNQNLPHNTSSNSQAISNQLEMREIDSVVSSFESLSTTGSGLSSRHDESSGQNTRAPLEASSFPPLPVARRSSKQKSKNSSKGSSGNTMASHLRFRNNGTVSVGSSSQAWSTGSHQPTSSVNTFSQSRPFSNSGVTSLSGNVSSSQARQAIGHGLVTANAASSTRNSSGTGKVDHSSLVPNSVRQQSAYSTVSNSPPVSTTKKNMLSISSQPLLKVEDAHSANKSLVERIHSALEYDKEKFAAFKEMSKEYRKGLIDSGQYLVHVYQFGLSHLLLELASLCPDAQKQKDLVETYNYNLRCNGTHNGSSSTSNGIGLLIDKKGSKKGKEKCQDNGISSSKDGLSDCSIRKLPSNYKPPENDSKGGYESAKGKAKILTVEAHSDLNSTNLPMLELKSKNDSHSNGGGSKKNSETGGGRKQQKKTSKFDRVRLGDNNVAASLSNNTDSAPDSSDRKRDKKKDSSQGFPVRGVWQNGGGRKLVANLL